VLVCVCACVRVCVRLYACTCVCTCVHAYVLSVYSPLRLHVQCRQTLKSSLQRSAQSSHREVQILKQQLATKFSMHSSYTADFPETKPDHSHTLFSKREKFAKNYTLLNIPCIMTKELTSRNCTRPFTSPLLKEKRVGTFACAACNTELFVTKSKFDSGTGYYYT